MVFFGAGVIAQLCFLLRGALTQKNMLKILGWIGFAILVGLSPGKHEHDYNLGTHVLFALLYMAIFIAVAFRKEILPVINEQGILQLTMVFWYFLATRFGVSEITTHLHPLIMMGIAIPSIIILCSAFSTYELHPVQKLFFYIWFLVIIVALTFFHFDIFGVMNIFSSHWERYINFIDSFTSGLTFAYLVAHLTYIIELIPWPGKHQSFADRWREVQEFAHLLEEKYDDTQLKAYETTLIIVIQGGFLSLNYYFQAISHFLAINLSLLLTQLLVFHRHAVRAQIQTMRGCVQENH